MSANLEKQAITNNENMEHEYMSKTIFKKVIPCVLAIIILLSTPMTAYAAEATTPTGIPFSEIENRIDEVIAAYMHEFTPGLAVAVVHNGEIVFMQGYGYADISRQIPVNPEATAFSFASISKLFVYVSVMQLVEQGLLDLDNDIHNYLPVDLVGQFNFRYSFTMRDLLNHSAGFADNNFNEAWSVEANPAEVSLREGLLMAQPVQIYEPGTATAYSNWGSALAGYIVGHLTNMEFADFERENIFAPLGITNTLSQPHWFNNTAFWNNVARGYYPGDSGNFNEAMWVYSSMYPAGSLLGTVADLAQFAIALTPAQNEPGPLFENRATLDLLLSPSYTAPLRGMNHGFIAYDAVFPAVGHSGMHSGFNTEFVIVPSERFGIVTLTNAQGGSLIIEKLLDLVLGNTMGDVPIVTGLPNAASVEGTYVLLRRNVGNLLEPAAAMAGTHVVIQAIDENTITLTRAIPPILGFEGVEPVVTYRQVAPYVFRAVHANSPLASNLARTTGEIAFIMQEGQPILLSMSGAVDATPMTFGQSMAALALGMVVTWGGAVFFLIANIVVLIKFLRRKKALTTFQHLSNGLLACALLFGINLIIADTRLLAGVTTGLHSYMFAPHIRLNYILLILSVVLFVASIIFLQKDIVTLKRKILYFSTIAILALIVTFLWQWNFFVIM